MNLQKQINLNEKIFIAGSSGMVGSSLFRILKEMGYGQEKNQGKIFTLTRKELNLLDSDLVKNWFMLNKPTVVILAAAKVGGIFANSSYPADFIFENLKIQTNVIDAAWKTGVKRFLFLGSSCVYPKFAEQPIKEEALLTSQLEKTNEWYAISKIAGLKLCEALRKQYNFDTISLMPTNLYGTGDNYHPKNSHVMPGLISKFCYAVKHSQQQVICWGSGKPLREFMHVDDLARAIVFVLENWNPDSNNAPTDKNDEPYSFLNVGSGKEISIKELSKKIALKVGFKGEIIWDKTKPDGTPRKILDCEKIRNLGWKPLIDLDEGLDKTIKEFRENIL